MQDSLRKSLEEAFKDSPSFRTSLDKFSEELDQFQTWTEIFLKGIKGLMEGQRGAFQFMKPEEEAHESV
jgi:hypothetical protein